MFETAWVKNTASNTWHVAYILELDITECSLVWIPRAEKPRVRVGMCQKYEIQQILGFLKLKSEPCRVIDWFAVGREERQPP